MYIAWSIDIVLPFVTNSVLGVFSIYNSPHIPFSTAREWSPGVAIGGMDWSFIFYTSLRFFSSNMHNLQYLLRSIANKLSFIPYMNRRRGHEGQCRSFLPIIREQIDATLNQNDRSLLKSFVFVAFCDQRELVHVGGQF